MKPYLIIILVAVGFLKAGAQNFQNKYNIALSDSLFYEDLKWVDFNNDSLLDVLVKTTNTNSETVFLIFRNSPTIGPQYQTSIITGFKNVAYLITDFNSDNKMDLLLSGNKSGVVQTSVFTNNGGFNFSENMVATFSGTAVQLADLNMDGKRELLISGIDGDREYLYLMERQNTGWKIYDTLNVRASAIEVWDFNKDLTADIFVSGYDSIGSPVSRMYWSSADSLVKKQISNIAGKTSVSDLNHDGTLDVVVAGVDEDLNPVTEIYFFGNETFSKKTIPAFETSSLFTGDLDKDGKCDVSLLEETAASDTLNLVLHGDDLDTLALHNVVRQAFGDHDRDGDLDIGQIVIKDNNINLIIVDNTTPGVNKGPVWNRLVAAAKVYDYVMLQWLPATDDHTASNSITYDVRLLAGAEAIETASFDQNSQKRLVVSHGNVGTNCQVMIKTSNTEPINFAIQPVDNAYHTSKSICAGGAADFCTTVAYKNVGVCHHETKNLAAPHGRGFWTSFATGILGEFSELSVTVDKEDTLVVISPSNEGACSFVDVFILHFRDTTERIQKEPLYVCENTTLTFETESRWEQVLWSSKLLGELSSAFSVSYTTNKNDSIFLYETDGRGCDRYETTPIVISKPRLAVEDENLQIIRGEQVQLHASGAESYQWNPAGSLDDPGSSEPMATPWQTTQYTVTTLDSIGCDSSATVLVIVEEAAFLPTLFTPNDDGSNDVLRAFGLDDVKNFRFTVYNREGSLVYTTTSTAELGSRGWDGTFKGSRQPAGVYYWKVEGENNIGRNLLLNGKNMGSVVLIR